MDNKLSEIFQNDEKSKDVDNKRITIKEFDDLFKYIGGIGPFQVCHILFIGRFPHKLLISQAIAFVLTNHFRWQSLITM